MSTINDKMTAIADQIRKLIGVTGTMGLDAMATNVTTANTAVTSAKTAITNKGVTVPSSADVTDLATYIAKIVTGSTGYKMASGSKTLSSSVESISITHNLGVTPKLVVFFPFSVVASAGTSANVTLVVYNGVGSSNGIIYGGSSKNFTTTDKITVTTTTATIDAYSSSYKFNNAWKFGYVIVG